MSGAVTAVARRPSLVGGLAATVLVAALVAVASLPTGAREPRDTVGDGARVAAMAKVGDARVLLVSSAGRLSVRVAYEGQKGWLAAELEPAPADTWAAWAGSSGQGPIPALAVVYGRAPAETAVVRWADGDDDEAVVASDGLYLVVRPELVEAAGVTFTDRSGSVLAEAEL